MWQLGLSFSSLVFSPSQFSVMTEPPPNSVTHIKRGQMWHENNHLAIFPLYTLYVLMCVCVSVCMCLYLNWVEHKIGIQNFNYKLIYVSLLMQNQYDNGLETTFLVLMNHSFPIFTFNVFPTNEKNLYSYFKLIIESILSTKENEKLS